MVSRFWRIFFIRACDCRRPKAHSHTLASRQVGLRFEREFRGAGLGRTCGRAPDRDTDEKDSGEGKNSRIASRASTVRQEVGSGKGYDRDDPVQVVERVLRMMALNEKDETDKTLK